MLFEKRKIWFSIAATGTMIASVIVPVGVVIENNNWKNTVVGMEMTGNTVRYAWCGHNGNRINVDTEVDYRGRLPDMNVSWSAKVVWGSLQSYTFSDDNDHNERFNFWVAKENFINRHVEVELTATSKRDKNFSVTEIFTIHPRENLAVDFIDPQTSFDDDEGIDYRFTAKTQSTPEVQEHTVNFSLEDINPADTGLIKITSVNNDEDDNYGQLWYDYSQLTTGSHTFTVCATSHFPDNFNPPVNKKITCTIIKS